MKYILILILCFTGVFAQALTQADTLNAEFGLNRASPEAMRKYQLGTLALSGKKQVWRGVYDFVTQGGASATSMQFRSSAQSSGLYLPKGAIVSDCLLDIRATMATANGATMNIGTGQSSADLKNALSASAAVSLVACIPVGTAATAIKLTDNRIPTIIFTGGAVTAGKLTLLIEYWLSEP